MIKHARLVGQVRCNQPVGGNTDAEALLQETLNEEAAADKKLTQLANSVINAQAQR